MSPETIGLIGFCVMILLVLSGIYLGLAIALIGFVGLIYLIGFPASISAFTMTAFSTTNQYVFACFPLFIMMGNFAFYSGIIGDAFQMAEKFLGHIRGGYAMATIIACAIFASASGSSTATAAAMGKIAIPQMLKRGYHPGLAAAASAEGGTLGILIPPSGTMIVYGILSGASIGKLFIAGVIPGILSTVMFVLVIALVVRRTPSLASKQSRAPIKEMIESTRKVWMMIILVILVLGSIYTGFATPTEAAAVGAIGTLIMALARRGLSFTNFQSALLDSIKVTSMIMLILIGAYLFNLFLSRSGAIDIIGRAIAYSGFPSWAIIMSTCLLFLALGCVMESLSIVVIFIPIIAPVLQGLGVDLVWFGIMVVKLVEIGLCTPPFGLNVFVINSISPSIKTGTIFRGITPFIIGDLITLTILGLVPIISLWLPSLM